MLILNAYGHLPAFARSHSDLHVCDKWSCITGSVDGQVKIKYPCIVSCGTVASKLDIIYLIFHVRLSFCFHGSSENCALNISNFQELFVLLLLVFLFFLGGGGQGAILEHKQPTLSTGTGLHFARMLSSSPLHHFHHPFLNSESHTEWPLMRATMVGFISRILYLPSCVLLGQPKKSESDMMLDGWREGGFLTIQTRIFFVQFSTSAQIWS